MEKTIVIGHIALIQRSKTMVYAGLDKSSSEKGYNAVGIFAGECREPEYMEELTQKITQYGLEGRTVFLGRRNDIPDLLKTIDMLIIPRHLRISSCRIRGGCGWSACYSL